MFSGSLLRSYVRLFVFLVSIQVISAKDNTIYFMPVNCINNENCWKVGIIFQELMAFLLVKKREMCVWLLSMSQGFSVEGINMPPEKGSILVVCIIFEARRSGSNGCKARIDGQEGYAVCSVGLEGDYPLWAAPGEILNSDFSCQQFDRLKLAIDQNRPELANRRGVYYTNMVLKW